MHQTCRPDHPGRGLFIGTHSARLKKSRRHPGRLNGTVRPEHEVPHGGVSLTRVGLAAPASAVFTPEELAARLEHYAARAALKLPLFARTVPRCA